MPTVDVSRSLLTAGANYNAGDWADVGAEGSLDLLAAAQLNRGIDLGLGVEALANLEGGIRKYIAADLNGQAHAAARVRAQVQMPLDLFDESGFAIRLQAVAEAAAGVQLAIGLSIGDFIALAAEDPRLKGAPIELLKIFFDEFTIQGGVMAKAAVAAMAYANVVATGSLIKKGQRKPGFTIAAEAGIGLKAGAGFRVFARFGVDDPRRLIRRTVDVAVRETLAAIAARVPQQSAGLLDECAVPLRIGFRCAFELGEALASGGVASDTLALRAVQVTMEELQRQVFESAIHFASKQLRSALASLNFDNASWAAAQPQRQALTDRLRAIPEEPFDANDANRAYWGGVVADSLALAAALQPQGDVAEQIAEPLAVTWCAAQLLMKSVERISVAQARASVIGAPSVGQTVAFSGDLPVAPPGLRRHINSRLGLGPNANVTQAVAISYLLKVLSYRIELLLPGSAQLLALLSGKGNLEEALSLVLSNIGAFAPSADGRVDATASLAVIQEGLRSYIAGRLEAEVAPLIEQATSDSPELRIYMNEVLLDTLKAMVDTVFGELQAVQAGSGLERALREMCSALLMRLLGRSLVVAADVLSTHALERLQAQFLDWARHANDAGGAVPVLASLTGVPRDVVHDLAVETLEVCAQTFAPMPPERRARVRDLMYQMIDTMPPGSGADTLESLKSAGMVGNAEAALELAQLLGGEIASNLLRFIQALLAHLAQALLALLEDVIEDIQRAVEQWVDGLKALAQDLFDTLVHLREELARLESRIDDTADALIAPLSALLGGFSGHDSSRRAVRNRIKESFESGALDALSVFPGYDHLPREVRRGIRSTVRSIVNDVLDSDVFDTVVDVLQSVSEEVADFLDDVRAIEPGDDLAAAISDLALDRIELGVRAIFDGSPYIRVSFDAPIIGRINLGKIRVPIGTFVGAVRSVIRGLDRFDDALQEAAVGLQDLMDLESDHAAAISARDTSQVLKEETDRLVAESASTAVDLDIVSPQVGTQISAPLKVRLRLTGASASALKTAGLSQQRLYLWINGDEVDVTKARVQVESQLQPIATQRPVLSGAELPAVGSPIGGSQTAVRAATARMRRSVREQTRSVGKDSARLPGLGSLPHRPPDLAAEISPTLQIEIDVPDELVHEGINTIACAYVPGPRRRRIERAASFLATPARKAPRGGPTMPGGKVPAKLRPDLAALVDAQGVRVAVPAIQPAAFRALERGAWSVPRAARNSRVQSARKDLARRLDASSAHQRELRESVASGLLRRVSQPLQPDQEPSKASPQEKY